ncbi:hypothetical protein XENTR_v10007842 [Xenopus tropicalis]|uniref:Hepatitis A virus cellular receptor 1 homolog isoform X2 n=1 Tax=Xenopus tropicalis TaxID=8364 RepID=A0A8J1J9K5_XENTR|nr:hepatitis A virus cellular receptor 1 homolog isoform X2 [Xenopus tropicalis]KAE8613721.1 hypothetical protein XENTR_v10007842 [Xenopus tropicalis]
MGRSGNWGVISLRICLFLWLQPALSISGPVIGSEGGRVLLPCTYSVTKGTITMCWGRGSCPASKCNNQIIRTDGREVTWKASERYGLMGSLTQGNVSLTITGLTGSDSGTYCCRVETPGWFNDQKVVVSLEVHEASEDSTAFATTSSLTNMALEYTEPFDLETKPEANTLPSIIMGLFLLVLLAGLLLYLYTWRNHPCRSTSNLGDSSLSALENALSPAPENVYYIKFENL